ncbi:hypothetical protein Lal_00003533 [Lupinus albus]|nr:hypothetical protein Lal_00003533 [Lupinus albus]
MILLCCLCVGFDLQSINWTRDVDTFLGTLSCLAFNGDNLSQYAMAEGLAEALMMYTKPFNGSSSTEDYYDGEKHCILVAAGNPVPLKMLVTVPMVRDGKLVLGRLQQNIEADFLQVTQLFSQGNNITDMAYAPLCNYRVDQFFVMLSKNFKEAREAIHEKRIEDSSEIFNTDFQGYFQIYVYIFMNTFFSVNVYEDIMAEMDANPLSNLFMPSQPPFDDVQYSLGQDQTNSTIKMVSLDALKTVEAEFGKTLESNNSSSQDASRNENYLIDLTKDGEEEVQVPQEALPEVSSAAITTTITTTTTSGIRSQNGLPLDETRGKPWVLDFSLVNNLSDQNSSSVWPTTQPSWYRGLEYGTSPTLNVYHDGSNTQIGGVSMGPFSSQYPMHVQGIGTDTTPTWVPTMSGIPQLTQWEPLLPPPPSVMDFSDYVQAWETLILSPTESEFLYVGIVFPRAVIFVEQKELQNEITGCRRK